MNPPRIPKTGDALVGALESHTKFLSEAMIALESERDRYKQLAADLRLLVCQGGSNKPLLLNLMDELNVTYSISPIPDLPFPIPMVDEMDQSPDVDFSSMSPEEIWAYHRSRGKRYSLREFVARALAVYVLGHSYSYNALIRAIAEQSGGSHEDTTVDANLVELESFIIGGFQGHVAPLVNLAAHVVAASCLVINEAIKQGYKPHYLVQRKDGAWGIPGSRTD